MNAISSLSTVTFIALGVCGCGSRPHPSDDEMTALFRAKSSEFEELRTMATADRHLVRIAFDFTRLENDWSWPRPAAKIGLPPERWDRYRQLFRATGIEAGIAEAADSDTIFFIVSTRGLVAGGSDKGFAFSPTPLQPVLASLDGHPDLRSNVPGFKPIPDVDHGWYLFYSWDD